MKQEDKDLLLTYLSMALPCGVKVQEFDNKYGYKLLGIDGDWLHIDCPVYDEGDGYVEVEYCKPYLRPLSSMTKEEEKEFNDQMYKAKPYSDGKSYNVYEVIGLDIIYLNSHHFDYLGLIPKGLAIAITEENNPY